MSDRLQEQTNAEIQRRIGELVIANAHLAIQCQALQERVQEMESKSKASEKK